MQMLPRTTPHLLICALCACPTATAPHVRVLTEPHTQVERLGRDLALRPAAHRLGLEQACPPGPPAVAVAVEVEDACRELVLAPETDVFAVPVCESASELVPEPLIEPDGLTLGYEFDEYCECRALRLPLVPGPLLLPCPCSCSYS